MKRYLAPSIIALTFFFIQLITISDYGINWDAPFRLLRGQSYLHFFLTGQHSFGLPPRLSPFIIKADEHASRFDIWDGEGDTQVQLPSLPLFRQDFINFQNRLGHRVSYYQDDSYNFDYFLKSDGGHPPFIDILSAASNQIFYQWLNWLGDINSYQLVYILISSFGVFLVSLFTLELTDSPAAAVFSGITLGLFPLFFSESHFNMKDPELAVFVTGSLWALWHWITSNKLKWAAAAILFFTAGLTLKWNILFVPVIAIPWLVSLIHTPEFKSWFNFKLIVVFILSVLFSVGFFILIWPYAWNRPLAKLFSTSQFYSQNIIRTNRIQPAGLTLPIGFNFYPLLLFLTQTPEIILAFGLLGLAACGKKNVLFLSWVFLPLVIVSLPHIWFYNGLREIMLILPGLTILSGLGFHHLSKKLPGLLSILILVFVICYLSFVNFQLHPNENLYFNTLAGYTLGAFKKGFIDQKSDYGNTFKQAADWLNRHADPHAKVTLLDGNTFALSPLWLRPDISLSPYHFSGLDSTGEYIIQRYNPHNPAVFAYRYPFRFLVPEYTLTVAGAPVLKIFRNLPASRKPRLGPESTTADFRVNSTPDFVEINFPSQLLVTRILISESPSVCRKVSFQFGDEQIQFIDNQGGIVRNNTYVFNEKKLLPDNRVEYSFPGETASHIRIYPSGPHSCFMDGQISSVSFIKQ